MASINITHFGKVAKVENSNFICLRCGHSTADSVDFQRHMWIELSTLRHTVNCLNSSFCTWQNCPIMLAIMGALFHQMENQQQ